MKLCTSSRPHALLWCFAATGQAFKAYALTGQQQDMQLCVWDMTTEAPAGGWLASQIAGREPADQLQDDIPTSQQHKLLHPAGPA